MWQSLIDDLLAVPGVAVETIDGRDFPDSTAALKAWNAVLTRADAAWIVAPESGRLLERLVAAVPSQLITMNATPEAIRLCGDKLRLDRHLERHPIRTIPTMPEMWESLPEFDDNAFVIKPRDGAGSQMVRVVNDPAAWHRARCEYAAEKSVAAIRQPLVVGRPLSIAGWFYPDGVQWFPVAEQVLGEDFVYHGGVIPAPLHRAGDAAQRLATQVAATIPGLRGYIGFDLVLPEAAPTAPVLVEINPRLTTSSLGIRRLCRGNWLTSLITEPQRPLEWHTDRRIEFTSRGVVCEVPC